MAWVLARSCQCSMPRMARRYVFVAAGAFILIILYTINDAPIVSFGSLGRIKSPRHKSRWTEVEQKYPIQDFKSIPNDSPLPIPKIQHVFSSEASKARELRQSRLKAVEDSFMHSWRGYKQYAWLADELAPLSKGSHESFGNWSATLVDSLDTLWIMGLHEEFDEATKAVAGIDFESSTSETISIFETTIRYLGGLLSAYDLSGRSVLLDKATDLGEMLYGAFDTKNRTPVSWWDWNSYLSGKTQESLAHAISADVGSLSMEFTRLSQITGDPKFFDAVQRIAEMFAVQQNQTALPGMWPTFVNAQTGDFKSGNEFSLGALADSLYEYLPKMHMLLGGVTPIYEDMYRFFIDTAIKNLFFQPMNPENHDVLLSSIARVHVAGHVERESSGQHLACFVGGMVGIGSRIFERESDLEVASKIAGGCVWAYKSMRHGIMPESLIAMPCTSIENCTWDEGAWKQAIMSREEFPANGDVDQYIRDKGLPPGYLSITDGRYILRPEAIESVFIMYRITGDTKWQDKAWEMFTAIQKATETDVGHASIDNVAATELKQVDKMESFWTAETLKYFYLIFSDPNLISLDDYVFNTEAHPFKRPKKTFWN